MCEVKQFVYKHTASKNPRPFLKWAGGKSQLTSELIKYMPHVFNVYHEPFVGGGSFFFHLCREQKIKHAILSDMNAELIDTYIAVRDCVSDVIRFLSEFPHTEEFFYTMREKDPWQLSLPERAARMIYLNKTGYNGLYRVNRQGKFNVPFGRYKSPKYLDKENLIAVSQALQKIDIVCASFETVLDRASAGDFVYFDPPYVPISATSKFTAYNANGFSLEDHKKLRDVCIDLTSRKVNVIVSNSDTDFVRMLYCSPVFSINTVYANRYINSNCSKRGKISELIIANILE